MWKEQRKLETNTTLKVLDLGNNSIGNEGVIALARVLPLNTSMTCLSLWGSGIGDDGIAALGQAMIQNDTLNDIILGANTFGVLGMASLGNALKINKAVKKLSLFRCSIDAEGVGALADALKYNSTLESLELFGNNIGDQGATALGEALKVNTTLTKLSLSECSMGDEGATAILTALTACNTMVKDLHLSYNDISPTILTVICNIVELNKEGMRILHAQGKLDLSFHFLGYPKAAILAKDLADNTTLTALVLVIFSWIHDDGAALIAEALVKNRVLTSIKLNFNFMNDAGSSTITTALQNNVLMNISLYVNRIGVEGATAIAKALQMNTSVRTLELGSICNDGAAAIADALKCNTALEQLDLIPNEISDKGALVLLSTLKQYNHTLTSLDLGNNAEISPAVRKAIRFVVTSRQVLNSVCNCFHRPLEKKLIPLVIHGVRQNSTHGGNLDLEHSQETGAGPIFLLVRAVALNDPKFIKVALPSRKRSRMP
jgi:Ran GTPase-activating protein (RanGAP) involved in mRNA processing and transport